MRASHRDAERGEHDARQDDASDMKEQDDPRAYGLSATMGDDAHFQRQTTTKSNNKQRRREGETSEQEASTA
jgi:hypothetical protein